MAKNNYEAQLQKAVLQIMNGCGTIAALFMNHKIDPVHKEDVSEAIQNRFRELKKQMEYTPPEEHFSLSSLGADSDSKKSDKVDNNKTDEPSRPAGLGGQPHTHGNHN